MVHTSHIGYKYLWMHRWISLCLLKWANPKEVVDKEKIATMISLTSRIMPSHLKKLQKTDLSTDPILFKADLRGADFWGANLSEVKINGLKLIIGPDLRGADFRGARLR